MLARSLLLLSLLFAACSGPQEASPEPPRGPEESVKPGANDSFLAEDMDVQDYVDRFEGESREIAVERDALLATLGLGVGSRVADVGAGTGLFLAPMAEAVGTGGRVYAVDISPGFLEHLRARVENEGLRQVEVVQCGERSVDLPQASVDAVFVCDVYHHFEYPRSSLESIYSALQPGGLLVVVDFERIPGVSREWLLGHVRADKATFRAEIEAAGFDFQDEVDLPGLTENYVLRFRRP